MLFKDVTVLQADGTVLPHTWVGVTGSRISYVGPEQGAPADGQAVEGRGRLLMPGMVNAHTHVPMTLMRGYGEDIPLQDWLEKRIFPFEDQLDDEAVYWSSLAGIAEMLASGTTSFSDMYYHCDAIVSAVEQSGIKANIARSLSCTDPEKKLADVPAYREAERLLNDWRGHERICADVSVHAEYTILPPFMEGMAELAQRYHARMEVHLSETRREHETCIARYGMTPTALMDKTGILSVPTTAAHCVWLTGEDVACLRERGATMVYCAKSNAKLGSGIAPAARYLQQGLSVAIGTDSAASNNLLDMFEEARFGALIAKASGCDCCALPTRQVLYMATRAGALSQGRADCGDVRVGYRADLLLLDTHTVSMLPGYDLPANWLYAAGRHCLDMTMVNGEILYQNGAYTTIDIERVCFELERQTEKILQKLQK